MSSRNKNIKAKSHLHSHIYALNGLWLIIKNERNFRIELVAAAAVIGLGILFGFTHQDWVAVIVFMALVLSAEAFNSVIEVVCDTITEEYHTNIHYAKDVSAGAVLITSVVALIGGIIVMWPYATELLKKFL